MIDYPPVKEKLWLRLQSHVDEFRFRFGRYPQAILAGGKAFRMILADERNIQVLPNRNILWRGIQLLRMDLGSLDVWLIENAVQAPFVNTWDMVNELALEIMEKSEVLKKLGSFPAPPHPSAPLTPSPQEKSLGAEENEKVDGLTSEATDKVNTARPAGMNLEE